MELEEKAYLWLSLCDFGNKKTFSLIDEYGSAMAVLDHVEELKNLFKPEEFEKIKYYSDMNSIDRYIENCISQGIQIITSASKSYPENLKNIDTPPLVLYAKGDVSLLNQRSVAIVGTRRVTKYGSEVTTKFSTALSKAGIVIISGLSYGVDAIAHEACVNAGGKTIAVLGCGVNVIYPDTNRPLAKRILENGGLIISEYKPNEKPKVYYFPIRNRIIAALSSGVLITEATLKSGSMHTKNYALDYGKDLYVVPGRITDIYSVGCNNIIKSLQGSMVLSPEDILDNYNLKYDNVVQNNTQISLDEQLILSIIGTDEVHYEEIKEKSNLEAKTLNTILVKLELKKIIVKLPGNYYSK